MEAQQRISSVASLSHRERRSMLAGVLHHSVRLACEPDRAFQMFTVNELLEKWFPAEADVEPKLGGKYELFWDPEDEQHNSTIGCHITAIEEDKLLCFQWKGPPQFSDLMNDVDPLTHVSVLFLPIRDGARTSTEVHVLHSGWGSSEAWQEARRFFKRAWEEELQELKAVVEGITGSSLSS
jgi:uncharacterized protein YndB with AHSA1/START domain